MDNKGRIKEILNIPNFVQKYIETGKDHMINSIILNDFCNIVKDSNYSVDYINNNYEYIFEVGENNYTIKRFVEFYLDKSLLERDYSCKYEEELNLSKSISNEVFIIKFEEKISELYILKYENELLYFRLL